MSPYTALRISQIPRASTRLLCTQDHHWRWRAEHGTGYRLKQRNHLWIQRTLAGSGTAKLVLAHLRVGSCGFSEAARSIPIDSVALLSERPRDHQRKLCSPQRLAVPRDPLSHHESAPHRAAPPPTGPRCRGKTAPACRQQGRCGETDSASRRGWYPPPGEPEKTAP